MSARKPKATAAKRRAPVKTYPATIGGRRARVTIPEDTTPEQILRDALREHLTPQAVTAIAAYLDAARVRVPAVQRQIEWFADLLRNQVGDQYNALLEEIGL